MKDKRGTKIRTALFLDRTQIDQLQALMALHGVPVAESIRRAIDMYLDQKADEVKAGQRLMKK